MFTLPALPYPYDALEPFYDKKTLEIHHAKHHQTYTDKLNAAAKAAGLLDKSIEDILTSIEEIPEDKRSPVKNHAGGYWNHTFFWESMSPNPSREKREAHGHVASMINKTFGSFDNFKTAFTTKAANHFGSGWAWLVINENGELEIIDTHDQVCPLSLGYTPLLTIDVWEHAYYLKFQNKRPEWIDTFWNIVNWEKVEERFRKIEN